MGAPSRPTAMHSADQLSHNGKVLGGKAELFKAFFLVFSSLGLYLSGDYWYDDSLYKPEDGFGYWIGLAGGVMMLLAYIYSMRKHMKWLRFSGILSHWLRIHIWLGIVGPYLIIIHTGFKLESPNAKYAFYSMVAVFLSGVVGRYLYSRVHFGLDGKRAQLMELHRMLGLDAKDQQSVFAVIPGVKAELDRLEQLVTLRRHGVWASLAASWRARIAGMTAYHRMTRGLRQHLAPIAAQQKWDPKDLVIAERQIKSMLREYVTAVKTVARFRAYDQMFMLWRMVHVPLLFLLFIAGVFHVVYVHMYSVSEI